MDAERKAKLDEAAVLLRHLSRRPDGSYRETTWHPEGIDLEEVLKRKVVEAERDLRDYRDSRAFRTVLDAVLPGWFDIDYSDFVRHDGGPGLFVSDDPCEWHDFMVGRGVSPKEAALLLEHSGHPVILLDEGASRGG